MKSLSDNTEKKRFWELDFLRGICVIMMVFDHVMYTVGFVAPYFGSVMGTNIWIDISQWARSFYWIHDARRIIRYIIVSLFFLLCGISCTLSRSNLKRGILCFLVGCGITFVTTIMDACFSLGVTIVFGVIHCLGSCMIIYGLIDAVCGLLTKFLRNKTAEFAVGFVPCIIGVILAVIFGCCWGHMEDGYLVSDVFIESEPAAIIASLFVEVYNYSFAVISPADYFPIVPTLIVVLIGSGIGKAVYHTRLKYTLSKFGGDWSKPVCFVGRHALLVYILHQIFAVLLILLITVIA